MSGDYRMNFSDGEESPPSQSETTEQSGEQNSERGRPDPEQAERVEGYGGQQSLVLAAFVFLSAAALVFGGVTIIHSITSPFKSEAGTGRSQTASEKTNEDRSADDAALAEKQKATDTDGDTLSDWEEQNTYHTSPYLKDTDGDGYSDKEEIDSGHDPLCASGKTCGSAPIVPSSDAASDTQPSENTVVGAPTPEQVRQILLQKGLSSEQAAQLSDADVLEIYQQSVSDPVPDDVPLPKGSEPTPAQIRTLLLESGRFTAAQLQKIDDATLLNLYRKASAQQTLQAP